MNFKKILIILALVFLVSIGLIIFANFLSARKSAKVLKETSELGLAYINDLAISNDDIKSIEDQKKEADDLYSKNKNTESERIYLEVSKKFSDMLKTEAEKLFDELKKLGNSTSEQEALIDEANTKAKNNDFKTAFGYYKSSIEKTRILIEKNKEEAAKLRPEAEEKIAKELIIGQLNKDYKIIDIKLLMNGTWAVATVQPLTFQTDNAFTVMQYLNGKWVAIAGPGTSFDQADYPNMPAEVINALNGGS